MKLLDGQVVLSYVNASHVKEGAQNRAKKAQTLEEYTMELSHLQFTGMGFTDVEPYAFDGLKSLQTLYLANNKLTSLDIRGPELEAPLPQLRFLHLQRNALTTTLGLGVFKALRKLYLDMNQVVRVEGLEACTGLQELYLDRQEGAQGIEFDASSVAAWSGSLQKLSCIDCGLTDDQIQIFAILRSLNTLEISENKIRSVEALTDSVLPQLHSLRVLKVAGNPLAKDSKHRDKILLASDSLKELDGKEVTAKEREFLLRLSIHKLKASASRRIAAIEAQSPDPQQLQPRTRATASDSYESPSGLGVSGRALHGTPSRGASASALAAIPDGVQFLPLDYDVGLRGTAAEVALRAGAVSASALGGLNPNVHVGLPGRGVLAGKQGNHSNSKKVLPPGGQGQGQVDVRFQDMFQ